MNQQGQSAGRCKSPARNPHAVPWDGQARWFLVPNKTLGKQDWRRATICQQGNLWNHLASIGSQIGMKFPRLESTVRGKPNSPPYVDFGNRLCHKAKDLPSWKETCRQWLIVRWVVVLTIRVNLRPSSQLCDPTAANECRNLRAIHQILRVS